MNTQQNFTTINEQIELLKIRGLIFKSEFQACSLLENYGYYNIINGYKAPYTIKTLQMETYKAGTTFEQIYSLFCLDHTIRNHVMTVMLDLEEQLRAVTSYVVGKAFGHRQDDYLNFRNYQNRKSANPHFSLDSILNIMRKASYSNRNPIRYHREIYGNVPPWVLFKGIYLSTLVNFIKLQKPAQKADIIYSIYPLQLDQINKCIKDLFTDTLFICLEYRNLAAHGGRVYNYIPESKIRITPESKSVMIKILPDITELQNVHSLGTLICLLDLFTKKDYLLSLVHTIKKELQRHCEIYPEDFDYLINSIGIQNIFHSKYFL